MTLLNYDLIYFVSDQDEMKLSKPLDLAASDLTAFISQMMRGDRELWFWQFYQQIETI